MRIADIMSSPVEQVASSESAEVAWEQMKRRRARHLVVVDRGQIVGVLSARDVGGSDEGEVMRTGHSVAELMTPAPVVVDEHLTLRQAANRMRGHTIGCLPITRDGKLVGIITTSDLLGALGQGIQRPAETGQRWTLKNRGARHRPAPAGGVR